MILLEQTVTAWMPLLMARDVHITRSSSSNSSRIIINVVIIIIIKNHQQVP